MSFKLLLSFSIILSLYVSSPCLAKENALEEIVYNTHRLQQGLVDTNTVRDRRDAIVRDYGGQLATLIMRGKIESIKTEYYGSKTTVIDEIQGKNYNFRPAKNENELNPIYRAIFVLADTAKREALASTGKKRQYKYRWSEEMRGFLGNIFDTADYDNQIAQANTLLATQILEHRRLARLFYHMARGDSQEKIDKLAKPFANRPDDVKAHLNKILQSDDIKDLQKALDVLKDNYPNQDSAPSDFEETVYYKGVYSIHEKDNTFEQKQLLQRQLPWLTPQVFFNETPIGRTAQEVAKLLESKNGPKYQYAIKTFSKLTRSKYYDVNHKIYDLIILPMFQEADRDLFEAFQKFASIDEGREYITKIFTVGTTWNQKKAYIEDNFKFSKEILEGKNEVNKIFERNQTVDTLSNYSPPLSGEGF